MSLILPTIRTCEVEREHARLELRLPPDLDYFRGHFPGFPVLAGVVQLHWAIHFARELLSISSGFTGIEVLKFQQMLRPDDVVILTLRFDPKSHKLHFSYERDGERSSSGRVLLD